MSAIPSSFLGVLRRLGGHHIAAVEKGVEAVARRLDGRNDPILVVCESLDQRQLRVGMSHVGGKVDAEEFELLGSESVVLPQAANLLPCNLWYLALIREHRGEGVGDRRFAADAAKVFDEGARLLIGRGGFDLRTRDAEGLGEVEPERAVIALAVLLIPEVIEDVLTRLRVLGPRVYRAQQARELRLEVEVLA